MKKKQVTNTVVLVTCFFAQKGSKKVAKKGSQIASFELPKYIIFGALLYIKGCQNGAKKGAT